MRKLTPLLPALLLALFVACHHEPASYAIRDFREPLQSHLVDMVSRGIVMHSDSALREMATDKELMQLSRCEHPVLRAAALREMLDRRSSDHFDVLMNHLDDTALVVIDRGEFGLDFRMVSDDMLRRAGWKNEDARNKTIDQVLTRHNYLRSAYTILAEIDAQEKYYPYIKDMATRPRRLDDGTELAFEDIEYALYGLAKFGKQADKQIIKEQLLDNVWRLGGMSFQLMKEFPDTAYTEVLRTYHRRRFYRFSGDDSEGFTGDVRNRATSNEFIDALIAQKTKSSAQQLDTMLQHLPTIPCVRNIKYVEDNLVLRIWQSHDPVYSKLRARIKNKAERIMNEQITFDVPRYEMQSDTALEPVRWY